MKKQCVHRRFDIGAPFQVDQTQPATPLDGITETQIEVSEATAMNEAEATVQAS